MSELITWDELREWCREHGAKNDRIQTIEIKPTNLSGGLAFAVVMTGNEEWVGRPFSQGHAGAATWQSTQPLRRMP